MKTVKKVLIPLISSQIALGSMAVYAQENTNDSINPQASAFFDPISVTQASDRVWNDFTSSLKSAKLKTHLNFPSAHLAQGLGINGSYKIESNQSIAGKYSGVDIWELNLNATSELLGLSKYEKDLGYGFGVNLVRQITFIQQFNDRMSSIARVPYDPVTKLPLTADIFDKKSFNTKTKKEELFIKEGDFISFRAPMIFSIGKGLSREVLSRMGLEAGLSYVISGEFDVHIFRMAGNKVRVKLMAIKDKGFNVNVGTTIIGFNSVGKAILKRIFDLDGLSFAYSQMNSDLFVADYIFNLEKKESRELYNQFVGHKMRFNADVLSEQLQASNPFAKDSTMKNRLIGDLDALNAISLEDQSKQISDRRVMHVNTSHNKTNSEKTGFKMNLLRLAKVSQASTKSISRATVFAQGDITKNNKYILEIASKNFAYELFWLWGERDLNTSSLVLNADDNFNPVNVLGFQITLTKEDSSMTEKDYISLKTRLAYMLPSSVSAKIKWPKWDFTKNGAVNNVYVQQEILLNENLFKTKIDTTQEKIKTELTELIKNYGSLKSQPMGTNLNESPDMIDPRRKAFQNRNYLEAYNWELDIIPNKLFVVMNSNFSVNNRYEAYQELTSQVPLFSELSAPLILKLIPEQYAKDIVMVRLSLSAKKQPPGEIFYPSSEQYFRKNIFRDIVAQTNYILNRTFDLRTYMKETGELLTEEEVLSQYK